MRAKADNHRQLLSSPNPDRPRADLNAERIGALFSGEVPRGKAGEFAGYETRQARKVLSALIEQGYLTADSHRSNVRLGSAWLADRHQLREDHLNELSTASKADIEGRLRGKRRIDRQVKDLLVGMRPVRDAVTAQATPQGLAPPPVGTPRSRPRPRPDIGGLKPIPVSSRIGSRLRQRP
jgi:hypothetical protein